MYLAKEIIKISKDDFSEIFTSKDEIQAIVGILKQLYFFQRLALGINDDVLKRKFIAIQENTLLGLAAYQEKKERYYYLHVRTITELVVQLATLNDDHVQVQKQFKWLNRFFINNNLDMKYFETLRDDYSLGSQLIHSTSLADDFFKAFDELATRKDQLTSKNMASLAKLLRAATYLFIRVFPNAIDNIFFNMKKELDYLVGPTNTRFVLDSTNISVLGNNVLIFSTTLKKGKKINLNFFDDSNRLDVKEGNEKFDFILEDAAGEIRDYAALRQKISEFLDPNSLVPDTQIVIQI